MKIATRNMMMIISKPWGVNVCIWT